MTVRVIKNGKKVRTGWSSKALAELAEMRWAAEPLASRRRTERKNMQNTTERKSKKKIEREGLGFGDRLGLGLGLGHGLGLGLGLGNGLGLRHWDGLVFGLGDRLELAASAR